MEQMQQREDIMKKIEINSFLEFRLVSAPGFSPDGKAAAFVVQQPSLEQNSYPGDLWLLDTETKKIRRLTAGGDAKSYIWTKSGTLLFPAARDKALKERMEAGEELSCWYEISPDGGEAALAFTLPLFAKRLMPVDEDRYIVAATYDNHRPDLSAMDEAERSKALERLKNPPYEVLEESPFWSNGGGFTSGKRQRLWLYTRSTKELKPLTDPWFQTMDFTVSGTKLLFKGMEWQGFRSREPKPGLWLTDLDSGEQRCLLQPDTLRVSAFAMEGNRIVVAATDGSQYGAYQYPDLYRMDAESGKLTLLSEYEASVDGGSVNSDARFDNGRVYKLQDGDFWFVTTVNNGSYLRRLSSDGTLSGLLTPDGACDTFDVFGEHTLVCGLYGSRLAELYLDGEQVTFFNDEWTASHQIIEPEFHTFTDPDGFEIHGWALKPAGYEAGKQYPAILHIHGGPRTVFGTVYHHEMQLWANAGYFVFFCNPRGSDGRGDEFGDINGKYGTVDYENLMQFTDEMLRRYPDADPARVGVTGGSYGGFMTNWIIGHTDRFAAAASQRSISNWIAFEHTSDIGPMFTPSNQAATTRDDVHKLWWHSPLKYAPNAKTPTLFIHSDADYRCWLVEAVSMFTALKMHGCEARMCLFKGETHELSRSGKPQNRIRRMEEILRWMDLHLK